MGNVMAAIYFKTAQNHAKTEAAPLAFRLGDLLRAGRAGSFDC